MKFPPLTQDQVARVRGLLLDCLKNVPEEITALLGEDFSPAGIALGIVLLRGDDNPPAADVITMSICMEVGEDDQHALGAIVCGDVGRALLQVSAFGADPPSPLTPTAGVKGSA